MNPSSGIMNSQPSASPRSAEDSVVGRIHEKAETGAADGFLFPPDDLIRSVLDLTLELEKLGVIEIYIQPSGAHFYRILNQKRPTLVPRQIVGDETARRVGAIFRRKSSTLWGADEIKAFRALAIDPGDLAVVEEYYKSEAKKPEGYCRTSLLTFLRHFPGEVDRARRWKENSPRKHCY